MKMRMNQAIARALADEMRADPSVVVFGEDVAEAGGVFKTSVGLLDEFGPMRVRNTPISELAIAGAAVGAAAAGLRPVAEIMFVDFIGLALDPIVTQGAFMHYLSNGSVTAPLVIRTTVGSGRGMGATHSRTLESWFLQAPGLKVAAVSSPRTAYGLLRAAIRDDAPVVMLEPKMLYGKREDFEPGDDAIIPLGRGEVVRSGSDATVVTLGPTVDVGTRVADESAASLEVIDLRSIRPWDEDLVCTSVRKTGRLVIVEEGPHTGGWSNTVAATVGVELFGEMRAPIFRITSPDVPVPFARRLETEMYFPSPTWVGPAVERFLDTDQVPPLWWQTERGEAS
ncbi:MAG: alpha-ketoacid dehydrogenase subunit beta [Actinobacteria bacterium]|nr:alpha-ketoacid dehydrogenase subunit beta [Actinomycetota bacterium]